MLSPNACNECTGDSITAREDEKKRKRKRNYFVGTKANRSARKLREWRAKETCEQRAARLEYMRIMARERRASETREQKEERLALLRRNAKSNHKSRQRWLKERQEIEEEATQMLSLIKEKSKINFNDYPGNEVFNSSLSHISSYNSCNRVLSNMSLKPEIDETLVSRPVKQRGQKDTDKGQKDPFSPNKNIQSSTKRTNKSVQSQCNKNNRGGKRKSVPDNKTKENGTLVVNSYRTNYSTYAQHEISSYKKENCSLENRVGDINLDAVKDLCDNNSALFDKMNSICYEKPRISLKPIHDLM